MLHVLLHVRWNSHETVRKQQMSLKYFNLHLYVISLVASQRLRCPFILLWKLANEPCDATNMIIGKYILCNHFLLYAKVPTSHASPKRTGERRLCKFRQSHTSMSFMIFTLVMVCMLARLQNWRQIIILGGTILSCDCKVERRVLELIIPDGQLDQNKKHSWLNLWELVFEINHGGKISREYSWSNPTGRGPGRTQREGRSWLNWMQHCLPLAF